MHHLLHYHDNSFGFVNVVYSRDQICQGPGRAERDTREGTDRHQVQARVPGARSCGRGLHSGSCPLWTLKKSIHAVAAQGGDAVAEGSEKSVYCSMRCRSSVAKNTAPQTIIPEESWQHCAADYKMPK